MKEEQIRKRDVFDRYLELVQKDVEEFFDFKSFVEIDCPACNSSSFNFEFEKNNFKFVSCKKCSTLFVNPRPTYAELTKLYSASSSVDFWVNEFFAPVAEARREKIFRWRAEYISKFCDGSKNMIIGDIGAGFGLFLQELRNIWPQAKYFAIEPSSDATTICKNKGFDVLCTMVEEIESFENRFDLLSAFELVDHLFNPSAFLSKVHKFLKPGGYFLFTAINSHGFDFSLLWEKSKAVCPPLHLNFFNLQSISTLIGKQDFEVVEISTPGKLDWEIVEGMIKNENCNVGRFWDLLARRQDELCKSKLQDWISKNNLSSHMMGLAKKPRDAKY